MEGIKISTKEAKQDRRFKRPGEIVRDTVTYPIKSKDNFSKTAKVAGFIAQTGAAAYLANRYVVQPSRILGKGADATVKGIYDTGKEIVEIVDRGIGELNAKMIIAGVGEKETESKLEATLTSMEKDINTEMQGQMPTTHSQEELQGQLAAITKYRSQFQDYQAAVKNNQKQMEDLKNEIRTVKYKIYQWGDKILPDVVKKSLVIKEKQLEWLGRKGGETYRTNYEELVKVYDNLDNIEEAAEQGLHITKTNYTKKLESPHCDRFAARQDYLTKSNLILEKAVEVPRLKEEVTSTDPMTSSGEQQETYKETVCSIVKNSDTLETQLSDLGIMFNAPPAILGTGLPIIAGVACFVAYSKLVKYEGKVAKGMKKTYQNVKNFMLTEDK